VYLLTVTLFGLYAERIITSDIFRNGHDIYLWYVTYL
jgi:hypothetical protein